MAAKGKLGNLRAVLAEERARFSKVLDQIDEALDSLEPVEPARVPSTERRASTLMPSTSHRMVPHGAGARPVAAWEMNAKGKPQNRSSVNEVDILPSVPAPRPRPPPPSGAPSRKSGMGPRAVMLRAASNFSVVTDAATRRKRDTAKMRATHRQVFANADQMKDQVQKAILEPDYNVRNLYKEDGCWQAAARSPIFDFACLTMIILNAVWLAVETDYNDEALLVNADPPFIVVENVFCTFFVGELFIRFMAFRVKADAMKDNWFMFDAVLVFFMAFETWLLSLLVWVTSGSLTTSSSSTSVLRVVRLFRLTRAARVARLLKTVPELMVIARGVVIVARTVVVINCLLLMIIYSFALIFTQLAKGTELEKTICSDMLTTMSTLLLGGILPDFKPTTDAMAAEDIFFALFFFLFVLLAYVTIMNMLIGVLVEVVGVVASVEKETYQVAAVKRVLAKWAPDADTNCDNNIDVTEFKDMLSKDGCAKDLNDVGVDAVALIDAADFVYRDKDALTFSELLTVVLGLRGKNETKVQDIVQTRKFLHVEMQRMEACLEMLYVHLVGEAWRPEDLGYRPSLTAEALAVPPRSSMRASMRASFRASADRAQMIAEAA
jgi:voltage-gated sodium channel